LHNFFSRFWLASNIHIGVVLDSSLFIVQSLVGRRSCCRRQSNNQSTIDAFIHSFVHSFFVFRQSVEEHLLLLALCASGRAGAGDAVANIAQFGRHARVQSLKLVSQIS
jgi:hypothetical protein